MFIAAYFAVARKLNQPNGPSRTECIRKMWCIFTFEYYLSFKKGNSDICGNLDEPRGHYVKRNKADRGRQILARLGGAGL